MTRRTKHGNYDAERGLPDKRMQPQGSGIQVWLQEQIITSLGEEAAQRLIDEARPHGPRRYQWMIERMAERGHPELGKQYDERRKPSRLRDKERALKGWQAQLATETNEARCAYIRRQIQKCEDYIEERTK